MYKKIILAIAIVFASGTANAESLVRVTGQNVNMRETPSTAGAKVGKAVEGMVFENIGSEGDWTHIKDLQGNEMYISSKFVTPITPEEMKDYTAELCLMDRKAKEDALYVIGYGETISNGKAEESTTWNFMTEEGKPGVIAEREWSYADTSGRMRADTSYFRGDTRGWYIVLTDKVDDDGSNPEKLDSPIYVYPAYSQTSAVVVNGTYFVNFEEGFGDYD